MASPVFGFAGAGSMSSAAGLVLGVAGAVLGGSVVGGGVVGATVVGGAVVGVGVLVTAGAVVGGRVVGGGVVGGLVVGFVVGEGLDVAGACTVMVPCIEDGWIVHWYPKDPAEPKVRWYVESGPVRGPEFVPSSNVTVCVPSSQHHSTVAPTGTVFADGVKAFDETRTSHAATAGEAGTTAPANASRTARRERSTPRRYGAAPAKDC